MDNIRYKAANCWLCGRKIIVRKNNMGKCVCNICKDKNKKIRQEKIFFNGVRLFKKLCKIFRKEISDDEIVEISEKVLKGGNESFFYGSKEEVVIALELSYEQIDFQCQKEIIGHKFDFVLPSLCVAVEIDGEIYHQYGSEEKISGKDLKNALGDDWEIVHIPCSYIDDCIEYGIENYILARLEETEHYNLYGYDENDEFWSLDSYIRRRKSDD